MNNMPTPDNPIVLLYTGKIPGMKNSLRVIQNRKTKRVMGVRRKKSVEKTMLIFVNRISSQLERQGWGFIDEPTPIGCYVELGVRITKSSKTRLPKSDLDNSYTTIQETWMNTVLRDDRQVADYHVSRRLFTNPNIAPYTLAFIWCLDKDKVENPSYAIDEFIRFKETFLFRKSPMELLQDAHRPRTATEQGI